MQSFIYEYQEVEDRELKEHIIATPELHKYFKLDWDKLRSKQYCGILNFNNTDYYLLPKISDNGTNNLNTFIYMLMYAYDIKLSNEQIASCENAQHTILEVFVQMFASNLIYELKRGIYKEYITEQDNLTTLKGKYLINENLKYNFTNSKIYCEYDEFSPNNSLNQFFLYAVKYLQKFVKDKKLLKQCELIFDDVEYKQVDIKNLNLHFNRLNQRFQTSFQIALLLLEKSIPLFSQGKKSFAFLFDMNILFEKFIAKIVKSIDENAKIQNSDNFGDLLLRPDIILDDLIIDTKYKKLATLEEIKQSDKLQAFAYGVNYKVSNVMLLFPKHLDDVQTILTLGNKNQVKLKISCIDLDFELHSFKQYIEKIKNKMEIMIL